MSVTSQEFLIKFFKRYLPFTPTPEQVEVFTADLSLVSPYLMEAALVEIKEGAQGTKPETASDWRPAVFKIYNRKIAEHGQLFSVFHTFETAFRSTVAVTLEQHFQEKRWWRPIYDAVKARRPIKQIRIGSITIPNNKANTIVEIIKAIDGDRFQRDLVGHFGNGFQFLEASDLHHTARLIEDHWSVFSPRFQRPARPPETGMNRLSLDHFKQKFKVVSDARNDIYHHKSVARMSNVVLHAEDLLDYLNYSLRFVCSKIRETSPTKLKFQVEIERRHRTWSLPLDRFISALEGISERKGLADVISVPCIEKHQFKIERALVDAYNYLAEDFHHEHFSVADAAFSRLGLRRPSARMDECAEVLLIELQKVAAQPN